MKKLLQIIKNLIKAALDEYYALQKEDLFIHQWKDWHKREIEHYGNIFNSFS